MSQFSPLLLRFLILGYVFWTSEAWHVYLPSNIRALEGSCVYIPCHFDYYRYPPKRPSRVVWYQWADHSYPLVCDDWYPNDVIDQYRGRTSVHTNDNRCSLYISEVTWFHHSQKLYPWVDPENVGRSTYRFFDTTVRIEVVDRPEDPEITITGERKVGKTVTVKCSADHTCYRNSPTLSLNIPLKDKHETENSLGGGVYRVILTTTFTIRKQHETIECTVQHYGGKRARTSTAINAQCSSLALSISPPSTEFLEGDAATVTCTALYSCPHYAPTLTWNYASMPASTSTSQVSGQARWKTVSTLTFTSAAKDHGKQLTCSAQYSEGRTETSIPLRVKSKCQ
ncbi:sialoadhesin-like isoform X2 [Kryptolebias marmoratus]|uniref:sialoadhesin-like isoform X3 n=1 Tax=Kryptolebias marmoratus TaxID=37003 RepID=UPI0018ACEADD|nr:sialoadhesin-like isoform X3 [Kryptolebias marmoratus]XP_037836368.1 sialoadhesin-like isoform X2 [Kryptolebias marmoratus]